MPTKEDDIVLSVKHLHKSFRLPHDRKNSLKSRIVNLASKQTYENYHVLNDINFEVKRGEFFGIVGKNGSGKSTLLKIIGQIYQPSSGKVTVNGTLTPFIELGIGFNAELTGRENIYLNGAILGLTRKEVEAKYNDIVAFSELEKFMDQKLKNYSSGMQVRLAFSIAMQAHNDILLIDEVLAVGDASFQRKCFQTFNDIKKSGKTVVFVTHDMGAVQEYCDRAMMIQDGKIVAIGKPRDIALNYEMANAYIASAHGSSVNARPDNPVIHLDNIKVRSAGKITTNFAISDDILVDIEFTVREQMGAQFNTYVVRTDGIYIAGFNTIEDLPEYKPGKGRHKLTCRIKAGQLAKGDYFINVAAYSGEAPPQLIDVVDIAYGADAPRISMLERSPTQDGEFYMQGRWEEVKN